MVSLITPTESTEVPQSHRLTYESDRNGEFDITAALERFSKRVISAEHESYGRAIELAESDDGSGQSTDQLSHRKIESFSVPRRPTREAPKSQFRVIQKWEGHVLEVGNETFTAYLERLVGEGSDQVAEVYLEEVDDADKPLVEPGSVFYWSIGYKITASGRYRTSFIRFRRLPKLTDQQIERALERGNDLLKILNDE